MFGCWGDVANKERGFHYRETKLDEGKDSMMYPCKHSVQDWDNYQKHNKEVNHCERSPKLGEPR